MTALSITVIPVMGSCPGRVKISAGGTKIVVYDEAYGLREDETGQQECWPDPIFFCGT